MLDQIVKLIAEINKLPKDKDICWDRDCDECLAYYDTTRGCGANIRDIIDEIKEKRDKEVK